MKWLVTTLSANAAPCNKLSDVLKASVNRITASQAQLFDTAI